MKLTKLFAMFVMAFSVFAIASAIAPSRSSAQDVWFYDNDGVASYLSTDTITVTNKHPSFTTTVKVVEAKTGKQINFFFYGFASENDIIIAYMFDRMNGGWHSIGRVANDPYLNAMWQTMKPYLRQKGVSI